LQKNNCIWKKKNIKEYFFCEKRANRHIPAANSHIPAANRGQRTKQVLFAMLCAGCGKGDATKQCARCKEVYYCDKKCQRTHWKLIHRETCGEAGALLSHPHWSPEATDGKVPMLQMQEFKQILTNHCIRRGSGSNVTKTLDQLWDGLGLAEYVGSTGIKEHTAEWDDMPAASQKKAFGRLKHLLESFHSGVSEEKQLAEIQRMASCYPPCCYPPCRKRSIFRCETCLSDTEKYCSQKCQLADYSRHMQTCVSYTVGAATRASKEGVGN